MHKTCNVRPKQFKKIPMPPFSFSDRPALANYPKNAPIPNAATCLPTECLTQIIENFTRNDFASLHTALLVNRHWCKVAVIYLWQAPLTIENLALRRQERLISAYIKSLNDDEKRQLIEESKLSLPENLGVGKSTTFNYASFLRDLDMEKLYKSIEFWWEELHKFEEKVEDGASTTLTRCIPQSTHRVKTYYYNSSSSSNDETSESENESEIESEGAGDESLAHSHDYEDQNEQTSHSRHTHSPTGKTLEEIQEDRDRIQQKRERDRAFHEIKSKQTRLIMLALWRLFYRSAQIHSFRFNTTCGLFPSYFRMSSMLIPSTHPPNTKESMFFRRIQTLEMGERTPEGMFKLIAEHNSQEIQTMNVKFPVTDGGVTDFAKLVSIQRALARLSLHGSNGGMRQIVDALKHQLSSLVRVDFYKTHITQSLLVELGRAPNLSIVVFDRCRACFLPHWRPMPNKFAWKSLEKLVAVETDLPDEILKNIIESARNTLVGLWVKTHEGRFGQINQNIMNYARSLCTNISSDPELQPRLQRLNFD
ncbi:hypothetical protein G9A89_021478 [Geosiphon pyriformis]|nr:hypothetical protein G9A89_021478 [Geosiphon pyriformis]